MIRRLGVPLLLTAALIAGCGGDSDSGASGVEPEFWGIAAAQSTSEVDLARMSAGGVGTYHLLLNWARIETEEGAYDWSSYDELVGRLATYELEPLVFVYGTPRAYGEAPNEGPASEQALEAWERFIAAAAERYGPDGTYWELFERTNPGVEPRPVRIWEIWNEMNSSVFWTPSPDPDAYAKLLLRASEAIEAVDPEAEIMTGGMFATPGSDGAIESFDFLRELLADEEVAEAVDIVGLHPYSPSVEGVTEQLERTRETLDELGEDAPLWVTEVGWGSDPDVPNELAKTPGQQAKLLEGSFEAFLAERESWDLRGAIWFTWRDSPTPIGECTWCQTAGLLDADLDPKPAWLSYTSFSGGEP